MAQWQVAPLESLVHPKVRPEVAHARTQPQPELVVLPVEPYPFMGTHVGTMMESTTSPTGPVTGPSMPESGARKVVGPFETLSPEMADLAWKRTTAIMKGSRPGC
jgi:hypothetical protein